MTDSAKLLAEIRAFLGEAGMADTTFGARAVSNSKLVARLENGGSVSLETAAKVRAFIAEHRAAREAKAAS